jgi:hypothetical protein
MKRRQREERNRIIRERLAGVRNRATEARRLAERFGISERTVRWIASREDDPPDWWRPERF